MWVSVPGACFCSFSHPTALSCGLVMGLPKQTLLQKCRVVWDVSKLPFSAAVFTVCVHLPSSDLTEYEWSQLWLQSWTCLFHISTEQGLRVGDLHRPILLGMFDLFSGLCFASFEAALSPLIVGTELGTFTVQCALRASEGPQQVWLVSSIRKASSSIHLLEQHKQRSPGCAVQCRIMCNL